MKVKDFDYELPESAIAYEPPRERGESRLLVFWRGSGEMEDAKYRDLAEYLEAGDVLVLNDTKVMKARLSARRVSDGAERELVVLERHGGGDARRDVGGGGQGEAHGGRRHKVLYRGKLAEGDELEVGGYKLKVALIFGGGIAEVEAEVDLVGLTEEAGVPPLPPYIKREANEADIERYQTVFAREMGSAAAPTASLNMTAEILEACRAKGVEVCYLTLHVGLGTFLPMRTDDVEEHKMHSEYYTVPDETAAKIARAKAAGKRVVAVGTTVARTLEYMAQTGKTSGEDDIFIYPGYEFRAVDALLTNFHAPRSTVLMLASAFVGVGELRAAYEHALDEGYRFLSYGDSMLILGGGAAR